jgi:molybdopterin molybdotransferase
VIAVEEALARVAETPVTLRQIGEAPAGSAYGGTVGPGETVRIFTGGPLPEGADGIVIQENTESDGKNITILKPAPAGHYVRPEGLDFRAGEVGVTAGRRLTVRDVGLAAAMNVPWLRVRRRPRIALLSTGDELVMPGEVVGPNQIIGSNGLSLAAFVEARGGEAMNLGIAPDNIDALARLTSETRGADLLVTTGGVSVGEHDLVREALGDQGFSLDFWKIAMRPGKPLLFGTVGDTPILGLPGTPVSSLVCAIVFLGPAIDAMQGLGQAPKPATAAVLGAPLGPNDRRQDYLRARLTHDADGRRVATPFDRQDSSMLATLAHADCLIVRPPGAPAAAAGDTVAIVPLAGSAIGV